VFMEREKMLFLDYHNYLHKYHMAQKAVDKILDEKEIIFQKTQPKSTLADHEREYDKNVHVSASGAEKSNIPEAYVLELERKNITERLNEAKSIMNDRLEMVNKKEDELRASKDKYDVVYVMRWLDSMTVTDIAENLDYSDQHVFRLLNHIHHEIREMRENESKC